MQQDGTSISKLSQAFLRQRPLYVNLLDDLGSSDFFVVQGDSLVLDCLSSSQIKHRHGGQMLHACYLVESFLHSLQNCLNARFCVVFFMEQQGLWQSSHPFASLFHKVVKRHLHQRLKLTVHTFGGCASQDWLQYIWRVGSPFKV